MMFSFRPTVSSEYYIYDMVRIRFNSPFTETYDARIVMERVFCAEQKKKKIKSDLGL